MTTIQSISDEIDRLVEANTLSGAGVKAMEALRVRVVEQEKQLATAREDAITKSKRVDALDASLQSANAQLNAWTVREAAIAKRELDITKLELAKAVAEGQTSIVRECFGLVFRNAEIREVLRNQTPVVIPTTCGSYYTQNNETRTDTTRQQT